MDDGGWRSYVTYLATGALGVVLLYSGRERDTTLLRLLVVGIASASAPRWRLHSMSESMTSRNVPESASVCIEVEEGETTMRLTVSDDEPGIPEMERDVVRKMETDPLYHGSGLSLWLVSLIVRESDGVLEFGESKMGGSSVVIRLPKPRD